MGKRKAISGQVTPVLNKFKNKNSIVNTNFGCKKHLFNVDNPRLRWSPYLNENHTDDSKMKLLVSELHWEHCRNRLLVYGTKLILTTLLSVIPNSRLKMKRERRWVSAKLILVMDSVTIMQSNVERVPKIPVSYSAHPSLLDPPATFWHTESSVTT